VVHSVVKRVHHQVLGCDILAARGPCALGRGGRVGPWGRGGGGQLGTPTLTSPSYWCRVRWAETKSSDRFHSDHVQSTSKSLSITVCICICIWYVVAPNYGYYTMGESVPLYWQCFKRADLKLSIDDECTTSSGKWFQWMQVSTKNECLYCCVLLLGIVRLLELLHACLFTILTV